MAGATIVLSLLALLLGLFLWRVHDRSLDRSASRQLIEMSLQPDRTFDPASVRDLPPPARRYFEYTILPGAPLCTALEITMTGDLALGPKSRPNYRSMSAQQVLAPPHGLVWQVRAGAIAGSDGATPQTSWTRFWLFGLIPVVRAGGDGDHHRSAFGRVVSEGAFWVPASLLPGDNVRWEALDEASARAVVSYGTYRQTIDISVNEYSQPTKVVIQRWSNENSERRFREQPFGGYLSEFEEFRGYRLPTRVEGGNLIDTPEYFPFYKAQVTGFDIPTA